MAPTYRFVDPVNGNNGNSGADFDNAWADFSYAAASGSLGDDYWVWVRRNGVEAISATFNFGYDGTSVLPIRFIGCPRAEKSTTGDFSQGSRVVDNIASNDMARVAHGCRDLTGPDGKVYFIAAIIDANTIWLNIPYTGANSTGGSFTIAADPFYAEFNAIDDAALTIKKSDWNSDTDDAAGCDFSGGSYTMRISGDNNNEFYNLRFFDSQTNSMFHINGNAYGTVLDHCYLYNDTYDVAIANLKAGKIVAKHCWFEGNDYTSGSQIIYMYLRSFFDQCVFDNLYYAVYPYTYGAGLQVRNSCVGTVAGVSYASRTLGMIHDDIVLMTATSIRYQESSLIIHLPTI